MSIKVIPLSQLEADPQGMLNECLDTGQALIIELPDHRLVSIQGLEPGDDDDLVDRLLESSPSFRALVEKSKASPRRPFPKPARCLTAYSTPGLDGFGRSLSSLRQFKALREEPSRCGCSATSASLRGGAWATMLSPASPPSGPRSMTQSAVR